MQDLKDRTRAFALRIIHLTDRLPQSWKGRQLGGQLFRSGTSVGAHYREGRRAKSDADLISKLEGALQELEESMYWLELIEAEGLLPADEVRAAWAEADELTAILVTIVKKRRAALPRNGGGRDGA